MRPEVRRGYEKLYANPTVKAITQVMFQRRGGMLCVCLVTVYCYAEIHTFSSSYRQLRKRENGRKI